MTMKFLVFMLSVVCANLGSAQSTISNATGMSGSNVTDIANKTISTASSTVNGSSSTPSSTPSSSPSNSTKATSGSSVVEHCAIVGILGFYLQ